MMVFGQAFRHKEARRLGIQTEIVKEMVIAYHYQQTTIILLQFFRYKEKALEKSTMQTLVLIALMRLKSVMIYYET